MNDPKPIRQPLGGVSTEATGPYTISVEEAGALLGLKRTATYEAVRRGEIPSLRIGGRLLVPIPALMRLLGVEGADDVRALGSSNG